MTDQTEQNNETAEYLPFNAINEFMRDDYRLTVLNEVITHLDRVQPGPRKMIAALISQRVKIPGFRNSNLAPAAMKAKNTATLFQQSAEFSASIIEAWSSLHPQLKETVFSLLTEKAWELAPLEVDRSRLPGFQVHWPKDDTFEVLDKAVRERMPGTNESDDDISLMVVWIGNRLPYDLYLEEDASGAASE